MLLLVAASVILVSLAMSSRGAGRGSSSSSSSRRYSRADVAAAIDLAIRAHPILPAWFVWAMADKESTLDPRATNVRIPARERSYGLFQINWNAHGAELTRRGISSSQLFDPMVNAAYWSELAETWTRGALSRGYRDPELWYAVRLRAKGVPWTDFAGGSARQHLRRIEVAPRFETILAKWKARLGA